MSRPAQWSKLLGRVLVALGLASAAGCLSYPLSPEPELRHQCLALPKCSRDHVYVFLLNGIDPVNCGNLAGVRDYLHCLGFNQIYFGEICHVGWFKKEIQRIHHDDCDAHFMLVGFNIGANAMSALAEHVQSDGVLIDVLVLLSADKGIGVPTSKPDNVARVVNILPDGKKAIQCERAYAENTRLGCTGHFGTPTHLETLHELAAALATLAAKVPATEPVMPPVPSLPEEAPTPRPVKARAPSPPDAWDFLKPVAQLGQRPEF
jgi:hypothetical protein